MIKSDGLPPWLDPGWCLRSGNRECLWMSPQKKQVSYSLIASWTCLERLQVFRLGIKLRSSPVPLAICSMAHRPKGAHIDRNSNRNREKVTAAVTPTHPNCQNLFWWYTYPSEKYEGQLGWLFSIYIYRKKQVPNHQPVLFFVPSFMLRNKCCPKFQDTSSPDGPIKFHQAFVGGRDQFHHFNKRWVSIPMD